MISRYFFYKTFRNFGFIFAKRVIEIFPWTDENEVNFVADLLAKKKSKMVHCSMLPEQSLREVRLPFWFGYLFQNLEFFRKKRTTIEQLIFLFYSRMHLIEVDESHLTFSHSENEISWISKNSISTFLHPSSWLPKTIVVPTCFFYKVLSPHAFFFQKERSNLSRFERFFFLSVFIFYQSWKKL